MNLWTPDSWGSSRLPNLKPAPWRSIDPLCARVAFGLPWKKGEDLLENDDKVIHQRFFLNLGPSNLSIGWNLFDDLVVSSTGNNGYSKWFQWRITWPSNNYRGIGTIDILNGCSMCFSVFHPYLGWWLQVGQAFQGVGTANQLIQLLFKSI